MIENKNSREYPYLYYYDDMGGDDNFELGIQVDGNSYFVIKYEKEANQIVSWHEIVHYYFCLLSINKLVYDLRQNITDITFYG